MVRIGVSVREDTSTLAPKGILLVGVFLFFPSFPFFFFFE